MGEETTLLAIIVFMGIITLLAPYLIIFGSSQSAFSNQTNANLTIIGGGQLEPPVCDYSSDIPLLSAFIWGADCIATNIAFMFALSTVSSSVQWLGILFGACAVVLVYLAIRLIRGGG